MSVTKSVIAQVEAIAKRESMLKGLKIKNKHGRTLHDASWTAGVDYADDTTEDEESESSEEDSDSDEEEELNLNNSENFNNNFNNSNQQDEDFNLNPNSDAHVEPEEAIDESDDDDVDENIDVNNNTSEQDPNLSSHGRPIHTHRPPERCRSFVQHANA